MLDVNEEDTSRVKKSLFNFIWNKKQDKIKRDVMRQDYSNGGLCAPDPNTLFKSFRLAWISRLLATNKMETIMAIYPNSFFPKIWGSQFSSAL